MDLTMMLLSSTHINFDKFPSHTHTHIFLINNNKYETVHDAPKRKSINKRKNSLLVLPTTQITIKKKH